MADVEISMTFRNQSVYDYSIVYWQTLNTQHLDSSFNVYLEKITQKDRLDCMLKSVHL